MDEFDGLEDFISSFDIYRGRAKSRDEEQDTIVGEFKVKEVFFLNTKLSLRWKESKVVKTRLHPLYRLLDEIPNLNYLGFSSETFNLR